ncbi:ATP-binding cassette, sub-family B, member 1A [Tribonema minus]|uniref:ATP-binding cassette, sub-family B, member 1A n=1 Tax=Tribonema minus TaxID=303371 RepID=A0A836CDG9_9STRA|nr:ATP-binding cassette, sub-family B, member 1A [Tribonema minus]
MAIGVAAALVSGAGMPYFIVYFGKTLDGLNDNADVLGVVSGFCTVFLVVGAVSFAGGFTFVLCWTMSGERQALRLKEAYVKAILRQDIGWFDEHPAGQLPSMVTSLMGKVQDGIGRKVADAIMNCASAIGQLIAAFYLNPVLSAILLCCLPAVGLSVGLVTMLMSKSTIEGQGHYSLAGAVANEVFAGIRTVASLCAEPWEVVRYSKYLVQAEAAGIRNGLQSGLGQGAVFMSFFLAYALAFWYGIKQVSGDLEDGCVENCQTGGKVISSIFGVLFASMQLGQMTPGLTALSLARASAVAIFKTIERVPAIDPFSDAGAKPATARGALHIDGVGFHYPARPDEVVYGRVDISIQEGETLALVGPSGGGKSTMTKLLLRFYDPTSGCIRLDGADIRSLNLNWYRQQIGYVGQEPVLFSGSIRDNIANGKPGATDEEITNAAKAANAHEFIKGFPKGYGTNVGEGGLQLSGGQKQRVAIARAIIKDPAILLLDEATSALDSESEKVVQQALDKLQTLKRRTTITIAHRLSTIQNSDRIAVVANKGIAEIGTHAELTALGGLYAALCRAQGSGATAEESAELERQDSLARGQSLQRMRSQSSSAQMARASSLMLGDGGEGEGADGGAGGVVKEDAPRAPMGRLWALNKPDAGFVAIGLGGALVVGCLFPMEGIIIAAIQNAFYEPDPAKMRETGNWWALGFVFLALAAFCGHIALAWGFATSGERMVRRLRESAFTAIVRHDIGWFDFDENSTGALTTRLEEDANAVSRATGMALGHKVQLVMTLVVGIGVGLAVCWQIGLVAIAMVPLIGAAGVVQMAMFTGGYGDNEGLDGGSSAGVILGGALNGITTVHAFSMQGAMCDRYHEAVKGTIKERKRRGIIGGFAFGYSQGMMFWVFALLFYYGAHLVDDGTVTFLAFFMGMFAVIMGAFGIGQVNADMDAQKKGQQAAARIFALEDEPLKIDPLSEGGAKPERLSGAVSFSNIKFAYPTRPEQWIYGGPLAPEGFSLEVAAGETVALVGPSGGGKSTCISLLMRFYDPASGTILVDGRNVQELNVHWLRSNIGYVGQEPVLFTGTIRENITRGNPDASTEEVERAAKAANAHEFIKSFEHGYDTNVGEKSALLSGGQKQRIAIARAILRNPAILLLDEATSALDNESERQVQMALDHLQSLQRRTTLVVAHRLTTVHNADKIAVLGGGKVCELGTHDELMALPGSNYAKLYRRQTDAFK